MSYRERSIDEFLGSVASERVTPAGGTALAVAGATGAALVEMACIHADAAVDGSEVDLAAERTTLATQREQLLTLGEQDAEIVDDLFGSTDADPDAQALRRALTVPLGIGQAALQVMDVGRRVFAALRTDVAVDARAGLQLAHAVVQASVYMVRSNLGVTDDRTFTERMEREAAGLERAAARLADW